VETYIEKLAALLSKATEETAHDAYMISVGARAASSEAAIGQGA